MKNLKLFLFALMAFFVVGFAVNVNAEGTDISGATINGISSAYPYTGEAVTPVPTTVKLNGATLVKDTDYVVSYENNIELTTDEVKASVIVTGIGDYEGVVSKNFNIEMPTYLLNDAPKVGSFPTSLGDGTYKLLKNTTMTVNRLALGTFTSNATLDLNGYTLSFPGNASYSLLYLGRTSGQTLNIVGPGSIVDTNDVAISVIGVIGSNYNITVGKDVKLIGTTGLMLDKNAKNNTIVFGGEIQASSSFGIYTNGQITDVESGNVITVSGKTVAPEAPGIYAAGYAKWTIDGEVSGLTGIEVRAGEVTILDGAKITGTADATTAIPNGDGSTTEGAGIAISQHTTALPINVQVKGGQITAVTPFYEVNPQQNSYPDISKITASISGGVFTTTGEETVSSLDLSGFITGGTYNVSPDNVYVTEGYKIFNDAGIYVVNSNNIADLEITGIVDKTYNGAYQEQEGLKVIRNGNELIKDQDYTVSYTNNAFVGTAEMTITGVGDYTGSVTKTFSINPINLVTDGTVSGIVAKVYTGKAITQNPVVKYKNIKLVLGRDYTVTCTNNKLIGLARCTILGKGNFTGTINKAFNILPAKVTIYKPVAGTKKLTVKYKAVNGGVKYQIAYKLKTSSTWKFVSTTKTSYTKTKLKSKKYYNVKVRAYKVVNGRTYYGTWSATKTVKVK